MLQVTYFGWSLILFNSIFFVHLFVSSAFQILLCKWAQRSKAWTGKLLAPYTIRTKALWRFLVIKPRSLVAKDVWGRCNRLSSLVIRLSYNCLETTSNKHLHFCVGENVWKLPIIYYSYTHLIDIIKLFDNLFWVLFASSFSASFIVIIRSQNDRAIKDSLDLHKIKQRSLVS